MIETHLTFQLDFDWGGSKEYPLLGVSQQGNLVLFTEFGKGTVLVVAKPAGYIVGETRNDWAMGGFAPYKGTIELKNKM